MNIKEQSYYNLKKIKQFLLDNDAYHNYLYNLYQENHLNNFDDVLNFFSRYINKMYVVIDFSFTWAYTKEGEDYWLNLHKNFLDVQFFKK